MEFGQEKLFELALNIEKPLYLEKVEFRKEEGELHLFIDFKKGSRFRCPICQEKGKPVYDTKDKIWRHLNFFQYKAFIHFRTPRTKCENDGIHRIKPPWAGKGEFTLLMDLMLMKLAKHMPIKQIADLIEEHDTKVWRIVGNYVTTAHAITRFTVLRNVGVDETSSRKGHKYITTFVDMDESKVIYVTKGKDSETIKEFKEEIPAHLENSKNIENFSTDMSPAFIKGIKDNFPHAAITFDKFHVMKLMNEAVDKTRREEQKEYNELKNTRYLWLKNRNKLNKNQLENLDNISKQNLKTARAYRIKLSLQDIYENSIDKTEAAKKLNKLCQWALRSRIESIKTFAKTLQKNWIGIINYFDTRLTNGVLEGINSLIQTAKARARGFRNVRNFIVMIYLVAGKLNFNFEPVTKI
jgi:transposase